MALATKVTERGSTRKVPFLIRLRRDYPLLLMVLPAVALLLTFVYIPLLGNVIAFMDYVPFIPIWSNDWVGLDNFTKLFSNTGFWQALFNTIQITFLNLALYFPVPIALAVFLHSLISPFLRTFVQSVLYLPHFLSWVIVVGLFQQTLGGSGVLNQFLQSNHLDPVNILANADTFKLLLTSQVIWKDAGWGTIIFLAALVAIDDSLYEAAAIDGAGWWGRFWHVTLPGLRPIIILLLILRLGDALSVGFEQVILQRDTVGPAAAEVLDTFVYYNGIVNGDWGIGIAAGLLKGLIGLLLVLGANKAAHLLGEQGVYSK
ncbi:ABC transporter permease [Psychromicrobium xiongbiense]|uniref:ABC transporter permease n=1 Tax=Psychromicrobium xiongbiense TaxID=3051184 RepID=UPI00255276E8|nr:ABC transporter permease subunit [Psychromicrobium sp. YIM S02556]